MPTRSASGAVSGVADSPMTHAGGAAAKLQPDNLGQVTPLGFSPTVEQARPQSSGRRRSRLAEEGGGNGAEAAEAADN